jgi:hypothetical protein
LLARLDTSFDVLEPRVARGAEFEVGLQPHPEFSRCAEVSGEPQSGIGSDASPATDDIVDARCTHVQGLCELVYTHFERQQYILAYDLPGMYRVQLSWLHDFSHVNSSVVVHDFNVESVAC